MNPRRVIAAAAAVLTVLLLQASLLSALTAPLLVSLPAVLVGAVGIEAGPSAGMSVGFSAGLLADLSSHHPAGVFALVWLLLGVGCGLLAAPHQGALRSMLVVTVAVAIATLVTAVGLRLLGAPVTPIATIIGLLVPTIAVDAVLTSAIVLAVRAVLRAHGVRLSHLLRRPAGAAGSPGPAPAPALSTRVRAEGPAR